MATKTQSKIQNGVDVGRLAGTVDAVRQTPSLARFKFRSSGRWGGGGRSTALVKSFFGAGQEDSSRRETFSIVSDEPAVLLGTDSGPNSVEILLSALAACMTVAFVYPASAQGIKVESLEYDIDGDIDLQRFLQISDETPAGLQNVRVRAKVEADAPREKVRELLELATDTSAVLNSLRNPVPVTVELA